MGVGAADQAAMDPGGRCIDGIGMGSWLGSSYQLRNGDYLSSPVRAVFISEELLFHLSDIRTRVAMAGLSDPDSQLNDPKEELHYILE